MLYNKCLQNIIFIFLSFVYDIRTMDLLCRLVYHVSGHHISNIISKNWPLYLRMLRIPETQKRQESRAIQSSGQLERDQKEKKGSPQQLTQSTRDLTRLRGILYTYRGWKENYHGVMIFNKYIFSTVIHGKKKSSAFILRRIYH